MIRFARAAIRGIRAELIAGGGGWQAIFGNGPALSGMGGMSNAGTLVSPETIMKLSAVWACTSRTSQLIGALPAALYEKDADDGRTRVEDDLDYILTTKPNQEQTGLEFWEGIVAQTLISGNGLARRLKIGNRLVGLEPMPGGKPVRKDGVLMYTRPDRGKTEYLPASEVFHIRGFGVGDGIGLSAVQYGVHSLGAALAADETASKFFANGMNVAGVLETDRTLTPEQRALLQSTLEAFSSSKKAGKTFIAEAGFTYKQMSVSPEDAQLLETRRFSVEDICRWFGVPPIIIGHAAEGQTMWGTGVEAIMLSWLTTGINPLLRRIEKRILVDLIDGPKRRKRYFEFNRQAMLQMDSKSLGEFMSKMGASGTMTANERRARLNLSRSADPNADRLLAQTALAPLQDLGGNTK